MCDPVFTALLAEIFPITERNLNTNEGLIYSSWKTDHRRILETFLGKQIIVTYSGAKDSSVVLHYMIQPAKEFGFHFGTHGVECPEHVFTGEDKHRLDAYWRERGMTSRWHAVSESEEKLSGALYYENVDRKQYLTKMI